jgi:hypothetical protein
VIYNPANFEFQILYILSCAKMTKSNIYSSEKCRFFKILNSIRFCHFCAALNIRYIEFKFYMLVDYIIVNIWIFFRFIWNSKLSFYLFIFQNTKLHVARSIEILSRATISFSLICCLGTTVKLWKDYADSSCGRAMLVLFLFFLKWRQKICPIHYLRRRVPG